MSQENVERVRRVYDAYNKAFENPDPRPAIRAAFEPFIHPEIEGKTHQTLQTDSFKGIDGIMEFFEITLEAFDRALQIPEQYFDLGDRVLVFVLTKVGGKASGISFDQPSAHLITFREGRAIRVDMYNDRTQALEAAGLSE